jgi:uncharacterized membrane protein
MRKECLIVVLFALLTSTIPFTQGQATSTKVVLWSYSYDGTNLSISLKNVSNSTVTGVLLCVRDASGVLIGDPLYYVIDSIPAGGTVTNSFKIENYPTVKIVFTYEGQQVTEVIYLRKPAPTTYKLSISSPVQWLEANLGETVSYPVTLKNEGIAGRFRLIENGLPGSIGASFYDSNRKVLTVSLDEGESKTLTLYLSLPSQALDFEMERTINFVVYALDENQLAKYENGAPLENVGVWSLELSLTPVGAPILDLSLDNMFARTGPGREIRITGEVTNTGSKAAENVAIGVTGLPYGWSAFAKPDTISSIGPGGKVGIDITVVLPQDASPGRYELSIAASSGDVKASKDFEVRVETGGSSPVLWVIALIFIFLIVAGIMIKLGRR